MSKGRTRRQVLALTGVAAGALAGCVGGDDGANGGDSEGSTDSSADDSPEMADDSAGDLMTSRSFRVLCLRIRLRTCTRRRSVGPNRIRK